MRFEALIEGLNGNRWRTAGNPEIAHIAFDSRKVTGSTLFVPLVGSRVDGHRFIPRALEQGAVALVTDARSEVALEDLVKDPAVPILVVPNSREALARLANRFYARPFERLTAIAITGTNGKTTTAFLVESILAQAGRRCALMGTIFFRLGEWEIHGQNTTPESLDLLALLNDYIERGADSVVLEASSHGLMMNRLEEAVFDAAVFTNLSPEHLDFHGDMERYYLAKRRLFTERLVASREVGKPGVALVNLDDAYGRRLFEEVDAPKMSFGLDRQAQIWAEPMESPVGTSRFLLHLEGRESLEVALPLPGRHNIYNALAAAAVAHACGIAPVHIAEGCARLEGIPGRLERVARDEGQGPAVFVDFAHTPLALGSSLAALREGCPGALWVVFGCGGDRDRAKRSQMGQVAGELADVIVLTSDNPRSEEPDRILEAIRQGVEQSGKKELSALSGGAEGYLVEPDRRAAISRAIAAAPADAVLLLAGKGHETTQEIKGRLIPFDDRQVAREVLEGWRRDGGEGAR
ncbi:MAG: UDP-N-acetylmuramoyl-L-alanyl-D-glutamate--2,6-diaminopimelate ligase [Bradymonadales bacterium]|nr:UDP-N-acetylmuramoyl-L-alanyl-D-glutamate--2,6-diaminopimelate ligase [Bradymonadales bacterium]